MAAKRTVVHDSQSRSIVKQEYRDRYEEIKLQTGNTSHICGDGVSLSGRSYPEAVKIVCGLTGWDPEELGRRYEHLNHGQQIMSIGNRLRAWAKRHRPELL